MAAHRSILFVAIVAAACGGSGVDLATARSSLYDTDFVIVYNAALDATRDQYPSLDDSPGPGLIVTAWQPVSFGNADDDQRTIATGGVGPGPGPGMGGPRVVAKKYYVRFEVSVVGRRPWRVKVVGHASELEPGNALPTELTGASRPHWLDGRTDALTVAIYKKIKPYAVPMKPDEPAEEIAKTDPKTFANVPAGAAAMLAKLRDALVQRDTAALRALLADDVAWSLGGSPGADTAMATWQADTEPLDAMQHVLESCAGSDKKVACPPKPTPGAYQLVIEQRDAWKVTSFVKAE